MDLIFWMISFSSPQLVLGLFILFFNNAHLLDYLKNYAAIPIWTQNFTLVQYGLRVEQPGFPHGRFGLSLHLGQPQFLRS